MNKLKTMLMTATLTAAMSAAPLVSAKVNSETQALTTKAATEVAVRLNNERHRVTKAIRVKEEIEVTQLIEGINGILRGLCALGVCFR